MKISAFTFGGGFVIISLMKKEFVDKRRWLTEEEMLNYTAIGQSSPGAIAVNTSLLVGERLGGLPGAALTVVATVLPPLVVLAVISYFYTAFRDNPYVRYALAGMLAGVTAVICSVVCDMAVAVWRDSRFVALAIAAAAFICVALLKINIFFVILSAAFCGALLFGRGGRKK